MAGASKVAKKREAVEAARRDLIIVCCALARLRLGCNGQGTTCFGAERLTSPGAFDATFAGVGYLHSTKAPAGATAVRVFNTKIVVSGGQYVARYLG